MFLLQGFHSVSEARVAHIIYWTGSSAVDQKVVGLILNL